MYEDCMKDIINSFKASLYERTVSPFWGSLAFYWVLINYKFFIIIFDFKEKYLVRFKDISTLYEDDFYDFYNLLHVPLNGFVIPIIISIIHISLIPFITNFIHKIWIWHQNKLKSISNEIVLTPKEYGELQRSFYDLELKFNETFSTKDTEIKLLKNLLIDKEQEISKLNLSVGNKEENILGTSSSKFGPDIENSILRYLAGYKHKGFNSIQSEIKVLNSEELFTTLDKLEDRKFVEKNDNNEYKIAKLCFVHITGS